MIMSNESPYLTEREAMIKLLKKEVDLLWEDYTNVKDTICRTKIKAIFDQKESQYYLLLREEYQNANR